MPRRARYFERIESPKQMLYLPRTEWILASTYPWFEAIVTYIGGVCLRRIPWCRPLRNIISPSTLKNSPFVCVCCTFQHLTLIIFFCRLFYSISIGSLISLLTKRIFKPVERTHNCSSWSIASSRVLACTPSVSHPRVALYMLEPLPSAYSGIISTRCDLWYRVAWHFKIFVDRFLCKRRCIRCVHLLDMISHLSPIIILGSVWKSTIERCVSCTAGAWGVDSSNGLRDSSN